MISVVTPPSSVLRRAAATMALVGLGLGVAIAPAAGNEVVALPSGCFDPLGPALRTLADDLGVVVGTAYRSAFAADDPCYEPTATREFNSLTPEIATFSNTIARQPGEYDFSDADAICAIAARSDMRCQVHNLVWDPVDHPEWGIVPEWIRSQPPAERRRTMIDHVTRIARHFRGRADTYTVVNEAFDDQGRLQANVWNTTGDESYVVDAFRAARRTDPQGDLYYNEFGAEDVNVKSDAVFDLVRRLRREWVVVEVDGRVRHRPLIDGVGLQMHVGVGPGEAPDPASVAANIARLRREGLSVRITEMDVRVPVTDGRASAVDLLRQRDLYHSLVLTCLLAPNCEGVTFWGFTDAHSWITENPETFSGAGAALPLDAQYRPKPAYGAIRRAFVSSVGSEH